METVQRGVPPYGVKETLVVNGKYYVYSVCTLLKVASYYDLSVLCMSVIGLKKIG